MPRKKERLTVRSLTRRKSGIRSLLYIMLNMIKGVNVFYMEMRTVSEIFKQKIGPDNLGDKARTVS